MGGELHRGRITIGHNAEGYTVAFNPPLAQVHLISVTVNGFVQHGPIIKSENEGIRAVRYYTEPVELDFNGTSEQLLLEKYRKVASKIGYELDPDEVVDLNAIAQARARRV